MSTPPTVLTRALQQIQQGIVRLETLAATAGSPWHGRWLETLLPELRMVVAQLQALPHGAPVRDDALHALEACMARLTAVSCFSPRGVVASAPQPPGVGRARHSCVGGSAIHGMLELSSGCQSQ